MKTKNLFYIALLAVIGISTSTVAWAQSPEAINYQTVIRNSSGEVISGGAVGIELAILQGSSSGTAVYTETHTATTNDFGLVNLKLGEGTSGDDFSAIDWANGPYFLAVGLDAEGGSSYTAMGTSELSSVPYAFMATNVENDAVDDADADSTNELITSAALTGTDLILEDAGGTFTIDMSSLVDNDADSTNELQTIGLSGNDLTLDLNGGTVDLSGYLDNTDAQTLSSSAAGTNRTITISNGNSTVISVADNDDDDTNEFQTISFANDQLTLSDGGGVVDFPYDSSYWALNGDTIYTMDEHVAIGSDVAGARLYVYTDGTTTNTAIEASAEASGFNRAIIGRALSTDANFNNQYGGVGVAQIADGESTGGSGWQYGLSGEAYINNTSATNVGVNGTADGLGINNFGVRGHSADSATIRNYGGYFSTDGIDDNFNIGVLSIASGSHTGTNYAFYGQATGASTNYAGYFAGDVTVTGTFTNSSDRALKTNIQPFNGALDAVKQIGTYNYEYKIDEYAHMHLPEGTQIGFIAQDIEQTFPYLVSEQKAPTDAATDEKRADVSVEDSFTYYKGVNYIGMIPVLTEAIKEQQAIIEAQQSLIESLEARVKALED
ncbi:MAG: hypothetical protein Salg2KO_04970 [Salibacteraceae bacterium]